MITDHTKRNNSSSNSRHAYQALTIFSRLVQSASHSTPFTITPIKGSLFEFKHLRTYTPCCRINNRFDYLPKGSEEIPLVKCTCHEDTRRRK